ncbi:MAG: VOC family protein [Candidatus Eremiobacteraeota bacterium]|nr:VOC family protein [Candidatus Eremiobacteraeota bacterium]
MRYPAGVPCWVDTLQPDPRGAGKFYGDLFGWEIAGPWPMENGGDYYVALFGGEQVAGIGALPPAAPGGTAWGTYVSVDAVEDAVQRAVGAGAKIVVHPVDASPAGRLAVLTDPAGAIFGVWEAGDREGAERVNAPSAWSMSALSTHDVDGSNAFYGTLFGWQTQTFGGAAGARAELYRLPGYVGGVPNQPVPRDVVAVVFESTDERPATWNVDFWIDDAEAAVARITRGGGTVIAPPFDEGPFRRLVAADPWGAVFSLSQLVPDRYRP